MIELRECQKQAVRQMKNGCILNGGVGSGKSRTALAYYYICHGGNLDSKEYTKMKQPKDLYIITTARKRDELDWEKEMLQFMLSTHDDCKIYDHKVVVDSWNNIRKYIDVRNAFFIFDEDKVTGKGAWVKAFLKISHYNDWILLSATPGDKYEDYIPVFIANGFFKTRSEFMKNHCIVRYNPNANYPIIDRYINTARLDRLRRKLLVDIPIERHTVQHHENIWCNYDVEKYKELMKGRWNPYEDKPIENISELCYMLRRVGNEDQSRQVALLELLEKHNRAIIFYNFDYELEILHTVCDNLDGFEVGEWNGHMHQPVPDGENWVYFVQYNAGSEAWNCTRCDTIIFYSQTYSYKTLIQSCGRIDRMDTLYTDLYYYHLKCRSKIDLAIDKNLSKKKKFNEKKFIYG